MKRPLVWILAAIAAVGVLAGVAVAALPYLVDTPRVQSLIAQSASHALGRPVAWTSMSVTVFPLPAIELRGLQVADDPRFGGAPFVKLERGQVRLRLLPLLAGRVELGDVVLKKPIVTVIQDAAGRWNFATLGAPVANGRPAAGRGRGAGGGSAAAVVASRIKFEDGTVTYLARGGGAASRYRLEGVDLTLSVGGRGATFRGNALVRPGDLAVKIADGAIALEAGHALTEAALRGQLSLDGKNVKDVVAALAGPSPAMTAGIKGALKLAGTVGSPKATGDVELTNVAVSEKNPRCPQPNERTLKLADVKMAVAWEEGHLVARPLATGIGKGGITTALTAALERGVHVDLKDLGIKALPLDAVLVDFLCQGYAVTGPLDLTGTLSFEPRDLWTTLAGAGQFRIGAGTVVGSQALRLLGDVARIGGAISGLASGDLPPSLFASPLDFDSITGTFRAAKGVVTTRDLVFTGRALRVALAGDYALASGRLDFDVVVNHGRGEVQAKVTGTTAAPSVRVLPASILRSVDREKVQSGLEELLKRFR